MISQIPTEIEMFDLSTAPVVNVEDAGCGDPAVELLVELLVFIATTVCLKFWSENGMSRDSRSEFVKSGFSLFDKKGKNGIEIGRL